MSFVWPRVAVLVFLVGCPVALARGGGDDPVLARTYNATRLQHPDGVRRDHEEARSVRTIASLSCTGARETCVWLSSRTFSRLGGMRVRAGVIDNVDSSG